MTSIDILRIQFLNLIRNRSSFIFMLALPIVFIVIFGLVPSLASNKTPIAVIDNDQTVVSSAFVDQLEHLDDVNVIAVNPSNPKQLLRNQQAAFVVTLQKGLQSQVTAGESPTVRVMSAPDASGSDQLTLANAMKTDFTTWCTVGYGAVEASHETGSRAAKVFATAVKKEGHIHSLLQTSSHIVNKGNQTKELTTSQQSIIGFSTMFIIFTVFSSVGRILLEKEHKTWDRLKVSPNSHAKILFGYIMSFFLMGWLQFLLMYLAGKLIFHNVFAMTPWVILTLSLYILAISGLAMIVAGLVKTAQQLAITGSSVAIITSMLGGAYWPIDIEPSWMQKIALGLPQHWVLSAMQALLSGGTILANLLTPICALAGFAVVLFALGVWQLRHA